MTTRRGTTFIPVFLASITHPQLAALSGEVDGISLDGVLRVANYRHKFNSRGLVYAPGFYRVGKPKLGDLVGQLTLSIDNVDGRLTKVADTLTERAELTLEQVYAHDPNTVRQTWSGLELISFTITTPEVTGAFGPPHTEGEFMGITINPRDFPGSST